VAGKAGKTKAKPMVGWLAGGGKCRGNGEGAISPNNPNWVCSIEHGIR